MAEPNPKPRRAEHSQLFPRMPNNQLLSGVKIWSVISPLDYNLHLGNHETIGVCDNTSVDTYMLTITFPWYIVISVAITLLESRRKSKSPVSQSQNKISLRYPVVFLLRGVLMQPSFTIKFHLYPWSKSSLDRLMKCCKILICCCSFVPWCLAVLWRCIFCPTPLNRNTCVCSLVM